jgi:hypothetical protein
MAQLTFYSSRPKDSLFEYINKRLNIRLSYFTYGGLIDWFSEKGILIMMDDNDNPTNFIFGYWIRDRNTKIEYAHIGERCPAICSPKSYRTWKACANAAIKHAANLYKELNKKPNEKNQTH